MSEKRFIVEKDNDEVSIKDKVKDNYPFSLAYEHIDDADNLIQECLFLVGLLNELNELNEELNKQVNNYHATFQSLLKTNLSLNNQLAETQKELKELYESLFPKPDLEHLNCRCSYEPIE